MFVRDRESEKLLSGHEKDTKFLYEIFKLWFPKKEISFNLVDELIPAHIPLNNLDLLFNFYFEFFNKIRIKKEKLKQQDSNYKFYEVIAGQQDPHSTRF